ncbi:MAG TPA: ABC transporter permease [Candidatus Dormibacteraeota bacterium]|nr:ABC transporter permease [Candidatus Dormibacteraeota bacterium]
MSEIFHAFRQRLAALFRRRHFEDDLDEELRSHLAMAEELNLRKGISAAEARREALRSFGGIEQVKEICRDQKGLPTIEAAFRDVRFGLRMLRNSPGFSMVAILCLTLGIGANSAVFSWVEGILFRPYPAVTHQERLAAVTGTVRGESDPDAISWPDFLDLQKNCTQFDAFIVTKITGTTLSVGERAERTTGSIVSANYFDAIGVHPILGRGFEPGEDTGRNAHPVVVISYQLWQRRFKGDREIIGKTQRLSGVVHTIVGVAPEEFYGTFVGWAMQFWVPASMEEIFESGGYKLEDRSARWIEAYVRLKPGVTLAQAQEEISAVAKRLEADYPETNRGRGIKLWPLWQTPFNNAGTLLPTFEIMLAVVVFVLLIACANVGNLLLIRSLARHREMTVRLAIGASRKRLVKQLFTEGLILSAFGAAGGLVVAHWCRNALVLLFPSRGGVAMHLPNQIDWRVLGLSAGVCLIATLLLGLVPAMQASKIDLAGALKAESAGVVGKRGTAWFRSGLVLVQVSLSFVLLVGTGLLLQSLQKIRTASPGFSAHRVLHTAVDLVSAGYDAQRAQNFEDELITRVKALPGVESAAFARSTPMSYGSYSSTPIAVDGYQPAPDEQPTVEYNEVGPDYFLTMGIAVASGREFTRADDEKAAPVAIVNETMAARYWRGKNPVGERLQVKSRWMRVVGLARDSKYENVRELPKPFFYVPLRQNFSVQTALNIRSLLPPGAMAAALTREVRALDPGLALYEVITLQEQVDRSTSPQLVAATLVGVLGGLALLLAAIGLYGVMSCAVSESSRELGLRMALGADASNLLRLVISRGLALTVGGVLLGATVALVLTRSLGNLLYEVSPRDPLAFGGAFAAMIIVSLAACFLPAWRATRTDPARILRD